MDWSKGFRDPDKVRFMAALRFEETGQVSYHESGIASHEVALENLYAMIKTVSETTWTPPLASKDQ